MAASVKGQTSVKGPAYRGKAPPQKASSGKSDEELSAAKKQNKVGFWLRQLKSSEEESRQIGYLGECKSAWQEYQNQADAGSYRKLVRYTCSSYPRYWSDTMIMLAALFTNEPQITSTRRFDNDKVSRTGSIMQERLAKYLISSTPFVEPVTNIVLEWLNCSKATGRLFYECEIVKRKQRVYLQESKTLLEDGTESVVLLDKEGKLPPEGTVVSSDADGIPYYEIDGQDEEVKNPTIRVEPLHFDEVRISPGARRKTDIWWRAYRITTTKKKAEKKFKNFPADLKNLEDTTQVEKDKAEPKPTKDLFSYWEIWNLRDKKVLCVHERFTTDFLIPVEIEDEEGRAQDDLYKLKNFFPSPEDLVINERYDCQYPVPDYTQCRDMYENLHLFAQRINKVAKAIKGACIYDGSITELNDFFEGIYDGEGLGVSNFKDIVNNGNLEGSILFPPYERLAATLDKLVESFNNEERKIDMLRGISDIIRGTSEASVTATAERFKNQSATNKFSLRRHKLVRFIRELVEMMVDLALKVFPDESLKEIMGFRFMNEADQANFPAALILLKDDVTRQIRLEIETDSLTNANDIEEREAANIMLNTVSNFMGQIASVAESAPKALPLLFGTFKLGLSKFKQGKHVEEELDEYFTDLMETIDNPPEPVPPPPDPKIVQIEAQKEIALAKIAADERLKVFEMQIKQQIESNKLTADAMADVSNLKSKERIETAKISLKAQEINNAASKDAATIQLEAESLAEERAEHADNVAIESTRIQLEDAELAIKMAAQRLAEAESTVSMQVQINEANNDSTRVNLEASLADATMREKFMEEQRLLQQNVEIPEEKMMQEMRMQSLEQITANPAPVTINVGGSEPQFETLAEDPETGVKLILPK